MGIKPGFFFRFFYTLFLLMLPPLCFSLPGGHRGRVSALAILPDDRALSAGADGFLEIWDLNSAEAVERFQVSSYAITSLVLRPGQPQVSIIENDGLGLYRISAWDYQEKKQLFTLPFRDPVSYITYSAQGTFLVASGSGFPGVIFFDSSTGARMEPPSPFAEVISLAATGRSERTMVSYNVSGSLFYRDLGTGKETLRLNVPANISSPILFGGNRFLAGFDREGLLVIDAVSGAVLARREDIRRGILSPIDPNVAEFACLDETDEINKTLQIFFLDNAGRLNSNGSFPAPEGTTFCSMALRPSMALLGTASGELILMQRDGPSQTTMAVENQKNIREIAASPSYLALLTEKGEAAFVPLDYTRWDLAQEIRLGPLENYTQISASPLAGAGGEEFFVLWQSSAGRDYPKNVTLGGIHGETENTKILPIPVRSALRAVTLREDRALFLDSGGNITLIDLLTGAQVSSFFSFVGSLDACFNDEKNIVLGRASHNSPFLMINTANGETVPLSYPSEVGAKLYQGPSGGLYAAVIDRKIGGSATTVIRLDTANPASSEKLVEFQGEDLLFSIAETGGIPASTLGGTASLYQDGAALPFERLPGFPHKLIAGGSFFITLDSEGTIAWHDPQTGKALALLRLFEDHWTLVSGTQVSATLVSGTLEAEGFLRQGPVSRGSDSSESSQ